jgi:DNA-binding FadR family transcriptional regulator
VRRGQHGGSFVTALVVPYRDWWIKMRQHPGLLQEIMEYREAVETTIARLAALRRTEDDLLDLSAAVDAARDCVDASVLRHADSAFHAALAKAAKNHRLLRSMLACRSELFVPANTDMVTVEGMYNTYQQHSTVLDAVAAGDGAAAAAAMADHIQHAVRDIQGSLDSFDPTVR